MHDEPAATANAPEPLRLSMSFTLSERARRLGRVSARRGGRRCGRPPRLHPEHAFGLGGQCAIFSAIRGFSNDSACDRLDHCACLGRRSVSRPRCLSASAPAGARPNSSPPAAPFRGGWPAFPWWPPPSRATPPTWWPTSCAPREWPAIGNGGPSPSPAWPRSSFTRGCGAVPACSPTWNSTSSATPARPPAPCAASAPSTSACSSTASSWPR